MTRRDVQQHPVGTAKRVIAHATWRRQRGRNPSLPYGAIRNPREALKAALSGSPPPQEPPRKRIVVVLKAAKRDDVRPTAAASVAPPAAPQPTPIVEAPAPPEVAAPEKKPGKVLVLSHKGWYADLAHYGLSAETKRLLRTTIPAFRHNKPWPEVTPDQYTKVMIEIASVQLNGQNLVLF